MGTDKTYVFEGNSASTDTMLAALMNKGNSLDPNLVAALMNNKNGDWANGGWIWILLLLLLGGRGFGFGNNGGAEIAATYGSAERDLLMQAINGNRTAISELAGILNTDINSIQQAICGIDKTLAQLSGQLGMSTQQVINSIQSGNMQIISQMANCCCEVKQLITQQGYENQLATLSQTNTLQNNASANTAAIIAKIDAFEDRYREDKFASITAENLSLKNQLSQARQDQFVYSTVQNAVTPLAHALAGINAEIAEFKCKQLPTVSLPYLPGHVGIYGFNGIGDCGLGNNLGACGLGC